MPAPARSCTRCAAARWRRWARSRSATTTAASMRRRCSSCWPALYAQRTGDYALDPRAVAGDRARAGLDRRAGRSRRRRLHRVRARRRDRSGQPGLEGFARRRVPCRRQPGRGPDRAGRGAGLRLCRQAPGRRVRAQAGHARARRRAARRRRKTCARRFEEAFWCEEIGTYALALDGAKRPCKVRTSNAGHALATGIALPRPRAPRCRRSDAHPVLFGLGHPHRRARARRATTRCPITTDRSGRTTTP